MAGIRAARAARLATVALGAVVGVLALAGTQALATVGHQAAPGAAARTIRRVVTPATPASLTGRIEQEPTADEVAASQQRAADLHVQLQQHADALSRARAVLAEAARQAAVALEAHERAAQAREDAQVAAEVAGQNLVQAQLDVATHRAALGQWARQAYVDGNVLNANPAMATLLEGGNSDDLGTALVWLARIGRSKSEAVEAVVAAEQAQRTAATSADAAEQTAAAAEQVAQDTQATRDAAVSAQREQVDQLTALLRATTSTAAEADRQAAVLAQARAVAQQWQRTAGTPGANVVTGPVGDCLGGDTSLYANGQIPLSALCPLDGAPGQSLRADAAYAFNRLSRAYQAQFGTPICVTDSYRSYDDQVRVYAEKPTLAARPGTSNHGLGTAADLCGGIESFGSATHAWMLANAGLFGWFHPAWAEPDGSKPEPWHWEFGG